MTKRMMTLLFGLTAFAPCFAQAERDAALEDLRAQLDATREELQSLKAKVGELQTPRPPQPPRPALAPAVAFGTAPRPMLGIVMSNPPEASGVLISAVTPDAPAAKAGLRAGDLLVAVNGISLQGRDASKLAYQALADMQAGQTYALTVERDNKAMEFQVIAELIEPAMSFSFAPPSFNGDGRSFAFDWDSDNQKVDLDRFRQWAERGRNWAVLANSRRNLAPGLAPMADFSPQVWAVGMNWMDLELAPLNAELGRYFGAESGVLVINTQLADDTLRAGDVIRQVDGKAVTEPADALHALRRFEAGDQVPFDVLRDGAELTLMVTTPPPPTNGFFYEYGVDDKKEP